MTLFEECSCAVLTGMLLLGSAMIDVSDPVIVTIGGGILAALTGTVKVLWDRNNKLSTTTDIALAKCQEEHRKANSKYDADRKAFEERMDLLVALELRVSGRRDGDGVRGPEGARSAVEAVFLRPLLDPGLREREREVLGEVLEGPLRVRADEVVFLTHDRLVLSMNQEALRT
jgi:hypothetical protein